MKKVLFVGAAAALGYALVNKRRLPPERVDVYREDGTLHTFEAGSELADRLLPAAREILSA
jgi:hypothetical protein